VRLPERVLPQGTLPGHLYGKPKAVIVSASEDAWEETIVPRPMAAGSDLDKVYRVDSVSPEGLEGLCSSPQTWRHSEKKSGTRTWRWCCSIR
jgi:hypothetical protein